MDTEPLTGRLAVRKRIREAEEKEKRDKKEKKKEKKDKPAKKKARKGEDTLAVSASATSSGKPQEQPEKPDALMAPDLAVAAAAAAPSSSSSSTAAAASTAPDPAPSSSSSAALEGPREAHGFTADSLVTLSSIDEEKHFAPGTRDLIDTAHLTCDLCFSLPRGSLYRNADPEYCMRHLVCGPCIKKACNITTPNKKEEPLFYTNAKKGRKCPICTFAKHQVTFKRCDERNEILDKVKLRCAFFDRVIDEKHTGCTSIVERCGWPGHVNTCDYRIVRCLGCAGRYYNYLLAAHEAVCPWIYIDCTRGCGARASRRNMPEHLEEACPLRDGTCPLCGKKGTASAIGDHMVDECPERSEWCTLGCRKLYAMKEMTAHENDPAFALQHLKFVREQADKALPRAEEKKEDKKTDGKQVLRPPPAPVAPRRSLDDPIDADSIFRNFFGPGNTRLEMTEHERSSLRLGDYLSRQLNPNEPGSCNHGRGSAAGCPLCVANRLEADYKAAVEPPGSFRPAFGPSGGNSRVAQPRSDSWRRGRAPVNIQRRRVTAPDPRQQRRERRERDITVNLGDDDNTESDSSDEEPSMGVEESEELHQEVAELHEELEELQDYDDSGISTGELQDYDAL